MTDETDGGLAQTLVFLRRAVDGDHEARGELLERLRPRLTLWTSGRLSEKLRRYLDPEDVAQEILLAIHKSLDGFEDRGPRSFYAWVFRVAENRIRDLADYAGAKKRQPIPVMPFSQTTPSVAAIRSESFQLVLDALSGLPEDYRRVITLRRIEEKEVREIATLMDRSENATRVIYCRALKALKAAMGNEST